MRCTCAANARRSLVEITPHIRRGKVLDLTSNTDLTSGAGSLSIAGYEYQIDVSVWLALDLVLASMLTQELVLEPATEEDLEADIVGDGPGRVTTAGKMDGYRLIVQAKLRTGDAWTVAAVKTLLKHGESRASAVERLADPYSRYLLVTSAALNGETRKLHVRRAGTWPKATDMPTSIKTLLPPAAAGHVAIIGNQDEERLTFDIKRLLTESFRVPNARWEACRRALRDEARSRIAGAGGGRWTRAELERLIKIHDGYIASSPELDRYVHPKNWSDLKDTIEKRGAALIVGQSGTGKTMATRMLYEELRRINPGLARVAITLGPQQLREDKTEPPVLYDIEDPWGRFDFDPKSRPWNDQLAGFLSAARPDRMIVATSRLDVAQSGGALETVKPWLVHLEAEHYGVDERRRLYRTRIDVLPRKLQPVAKGEEGSVLAALFTPLEIQKFFDALATLDMEELSGTAAVAEAIRRAHENSIERTVIDQIEQRNDVRAGAVIWGLLKANDRLSRRVLRLIEEELAERNAHFEKGISPLIDFFVAARNLRQIEASVTYYHPRVEAGIEKALERNRLVATKALRTLVDVLVSLDDSGNAWGVAAAVRLIAAADRNQDLKPNPAPAAQAAIDAWLSSELAKHGKDFEANLNLAAAAGSVASNVSEAARFLLHRPDTDFGAMHIWGAPIHDESWYARLRADPDVRTLVETFVVEVLPNTRDSFGEDFVIAANRLAGDLTQAFLAAASKAVYNGVMYSSEAIVDGALNDLRGFEEVLDTAVAVLTPTDTERIEAEEIRLAVINGEYSEYHAEHIGDNEEGYTANNFLSAYVDRVRATAGWRKLAQHRHLDRLRYSWFRALAKEDVPDQDEIAGGFAVGYGTDDEDDLWDTLRKAWDPRFEDLLVERLLNAHPNSLVRLAALACLIEREPGRLSVIADDLLSRGHEARLVEIALELGEMQQKLSHPDNTRQVHVAASAAATLPRPFFEISQYAVALASDNSPTLSDAARELIIGLSRIQENVRVFRLQVARYFEIPVEEDVRWILNHSDDNDAAVLAVETAIRHGMSKEVDAALNHKFAHVVARALEAIATSMTAPLPDHLLALTAAKGSPVRRTLVGLLEAKPHPDHFPALLRLVQDKWSSHDFYYGDDEDYPIARNAVRAIDKFDEVDAASADELYRIALDSRDPTLRYEIFKLLASKAKIEMQELLLALAVHKGQKFVRIAAAHALLACSDRLAPEVVGRISAQIIVTKIEPVASRLIMVVARRGEPHHIFTIAELLATDHKRRVLLLLVIWMLRNRDQATANRIVAMLPANHPAVARVLLGADTEITSAMLEDLGDQLNVDQVLQIMAPKKK